MINFDVPNVPEDYVHRIGRTARNEAAGDAISLVSREEAPYVRAIERLTGIPIPARTIAGFEPQPGRAPYPMDRAHRAHGGAQPRHNGQRFGGSHPQGGEARASRHARRHLFRKRRGR